MTEALTIGYVGNFRPDHSTENHVRLALESHGHRVVQLQEDEAGSWNLLCEPARIAEAELDLVFWTRTWHLPQYPQLQALETLKRARVGTVAFHLDRWWGLDREHQVRDEPMFRCDLVITADGDPGHASRFHDAGVNHVWLSPAVSGVEARRVGKPQRIFGKPVTFVGSHRQYHQEWPYRLQLVDHLRHQYRGRLGLWPQTRGIRGQELADLYASTAVVVGDSCLAGGISNYWSDRIPETLGRGGFLIHPYVDGLADHYVLAGPDRELVTYQWGDFAELDHLIRYYLEHPDERLAVVQRGRARVLAEHTYERRTEQVLELARERNLVRTTRGASGPVTVKGPRGTVGQFVLRPGSTDGLVVDEVWREDVYRLADVDVSGGVVVDVGANCGAFSVWAAKAGAAVVHAYEPELSNLHALDDNLEASGVADVVQVWREAVWDDVAASLWVDQVHLGGEGEVQTREDSPGLLTGPEDSVTARGLSFVLRRAGDRIRLLKLDCEGCEWPALIGMDPQDLVRVEQIVLEFHGAAMDHLDLEGGYNLGRLLHVLAEWGHLEVLGRPSTGGSIWWRRY